jgi:TldD protein
MLFKALKKSTSDYIEVRFEIEDSTTIAYRNKDLDKIDSNNMSRGIVRACTKGGWGITTFNSLDDLEHQVQEACQCAALVGRNKTKLAETEKVDATVPAKMERDFREVSFDEKIKLISRYNDIILTTDPAIKTSFVKYNESFRTVYFVSSRGSYFMEERPKVAISFSAIARDGSLVQRAHDHGIASVVTYDAIVGQETRIEKTAKQAVKLLKAPPCEGGTYVVILDPQLAGVFAHEAFGHMSEADSLYENAKMRELMYIGRKVGVKELNIVDEGSLPNRIGTQVFDDEGTPTSKTDLVREGILVGRLHSLETAAKMGERPTGNARAIRGDKPPIVRMTNTYIKPGDLSFDELISGIDKGIYVGGVIGGQTMKEMFTFSAAYGYRIENGRICGLLRDIVLTGNVFETLYKIDGFGNDLQIFETDGGCGKGGQSPLPVTYGSPHIRIHDVLVGGK